MRLGLSILFFASLLPLSVQAQNQNDFYQDLLISKEVKAEDARQKELAKQQQLLQNTKELTNNLLNQKAHKLKVNIPLMQRRTSQIDSDKLTKSTQNLVPAPFGLLWQAGIEALKNMGIIFTPLEHRDYINHYQASKLPKDPKGFREVQTSFGLENQLWHIVALGDYVEDDASASKILKIYRSYSRVLSRKYGPATEHFSPKTTIVNKNINGREVAEKVIEPIGNPAFLKQLQNREAELFSTFQTDNLGVALAVNVDENGQSYIIIDYKNIKFLQEQENKALDIL